MSESGRASQRPQRLPRTGAPLREDTRGQTGTLWRRVTTQQCPDYYHAMHRARDNMQCPSLCIVRVCVCVVGCTCVLLDAKDKSVLNTPTQWAMLTHVDL